jgi:hypothetical protein
MSREGLSWRRGGRRDGRDGKEEIKSHNPRINRRNIKMMQQGGERIARERGYSKVSWTEGIKEKQSFVGSRGSAATEVVSRC